MTTKNFEDAIAELLQQMAAATPRDKEFAMEQLRNAISSTDRPFLRPIDALDETDPFDNVPV